MLMWKIIAVTKKQRNRVADTAFDESKENLGTQ